MTYNLEVTFRKVSKKKRQLKQEIIKLMQKLDIKSAGMVETGSEKF